MRNYHYEMKWQKLLTPEIVSFLTTIHEYKGQQHLIANRHTDVLTDLVRDECEMAEYLFDFSLLRHGKRQRWLKGFAKHSSISRCSCYK